MWFIGGNSNDDDDDVASVRLEKFTSILFLCMCELCECEWVSCNEEKFSAILHLLLTPLDSLVLNEHVIAFETCSFTHYMGFQSFVYKCDY